MHKKIGALLFSLLLLAFLTVFFPVPVSAADSMQISQLIENAKTNDGKQVILTGEAIGESMQRGESCWVNIKDSSNAIGIWMSLADAQQIRFYGNYRQIGDIISVTGIFHRACVEHGGEADIHCEELTIKEKGFPVADKVDSKKGMLAGGLFLALLLVGTMVYFSVIHTKKRM